MAEAGRSTILTDELFRKIKESILNGNDLRETAKVCEIVESTLYTWHSDNYLNIRDKIEGWKRDRKLILAEKNIEEILQMGTINNVVTKKGDLITVNDTGILRVKADISKFVAETLGKDNYAKRSELTGKDGEQLLPQPLLGGQSNGVQNNNSNTEASGTQEKA